MYLADEIGNEYKTWGNENIFLTGLCGSGKTHFAINVLTVYAINEGKRVLYLSHRKVINNEKYPLFNEAISNASNKELLDISTYQSLEKKVASNKELPEYDYVILDEFHYLLSDSWNRSTDFSFEQILKWNRSTCLIFITATPEHIKEFLLSEGLTFTKEYGSSTPEYKYIDYCYFFNGNSTNDLILRVQQTLAKSETDKILVIVKSYNELLKFHEVFGKEANYMCSQSSSNKEARKINQPDCITSSGIDSVTGRQIRTFPKRLLVSTSIMCEGIDLCDRNIKHIVVNLMDPLQVIQTIGRKRSLDPDDTCNIYISYLPIKIIEEEIEHFDSFLNEFYTYTNKEVIGRRYDQAYSRVMGQLYDLDMFSSAEYNKYLQMGFISANNGRTPEGCYLDLRDKTIKSSITRRFYLETRSEILREISQETGGHKKYMKHLLEKYVKTIHSILWNDKIIFDFMKSNKDKRFYKKDQLVLCNVVNYKNDKGRLFTSASKINEYFHDKKIPYEIKVFDDNNRKSRYYKHKYWKIFCT